MEGKIQAMLILLYQFPRTIEESEGNFNFIPVYLLVKLRTSTKKISPYFLGQSSHNLFEGDKNHKTVLSYSLNTGSYYGFGFRFDSRRGIQCEIVYSVNSGSASTELFNKDIEYQKISLLVGYNF